MLKRSSFKCLILLLSLGGCIPVLSAQVAQAVCPGLFFTYPVKPGLSDNEKAFVCPSGEAGWKSIPMSQRELHMRGILQSRGFDNPKFTSRDSGLWVDPGPLSRVKNIVFRFTGSPAQVDARWNWMGRPISPSLLNEVEKKTAGELQSRGYPCASTRATVPDPRNGVVIVTVDKGVKERWTPDEIQISAALSKLYSKRLISRYHAFLEGREFDQELLMLTAQRMEAAGLFESAYFVPQCEKGVLTRLQLRGTVGLPRLFTVGVGVDTEGILKARISWRHARLGSRASSLELIALGSRYRQELTGTMRWYLSDESPRVHLLPTLSLVRRSEVHFESYALGLSLHPATTFELPTGQMEVVLGPTFQQNKTTRGIDQGDIFILSLETKLTYISHSLEAQTADPVHGSYAQLEFAATDRAILSDVSAWRARLFLRNLWNIGRFDPPRAILAIRGAINATGHAAGKLPSDFRYFLGGSDTLRGFSRLELPSNGTGALSSFYAGLELRFPSLLPWSLQPVIFMDAGALGDAPFEWESPMYASPGFGLRWNSPIGVFRSTLAHGFSVGGSSSPRWAAPSHWQFFIGYGEEF